jgi:hypothetical protein
MAESHLLTTKHPDVNMTPDFSHIKTKAVGQIGWSNHDHPLYIIIFQAVKQIKTNNEITLNWTKQDHILSLWQHKHIHWRGQWINIRIYEFEYIKWKVYHSHMFLSEMMFIKFIMVRVSGKASILVSTR